MNAKRLASLSLFLIVAVSCTDRRSAKPFTGEGGLLSGTSSVVQVAQVRLQNSPMRISRMVFAGGFLNLIGRPFGFARWDVVTNPESPRKIFAAIDNMPEFSPDPPFGGWTPDGFGAGSMALLFSQYLVMSGNIGTSIIQVGPNSTYAKEVSRFPGINPQGEIGSDPRFQYKGIVISPDSSTLYGFTLSDGYYSSTISRGYSGAPSLSTPSVLTPYGSGPTCCVSGVVPFGGNVYVGFGNQLWILQFSGNQLLKWKTVTALHASNIAASSNYLFVQSNATSSVGSTYQDGIYVIDPSGNVVNYLGVNPLLFAVSPDGLYLYTDEGDGSIKIYRITQPQ